MKIFSSYIAIFLFLFSASAQSDGILWKISGNGLKKPSYIFGTIHYHCQPQSVNKTPVNKAIKASSTVALELDLGNVDVLMDMYQSSLKKSGTSLQAVLTSREFQSVDSVCRIFLEDSLAVFDSRSPMELMSMLLMSEKFMGCKGLPIDFTIVQMAKNAGKPTTGLETYHFQDSLMKSIPVELQIKWLMEFCKDTAEAKRNFNELTSAYNEQNSQRLYKVAFESSPEYAYLNDALLIQRNLNWFNFLKLNMPVKSYFTAVGAAHLGGETGLINLLKNAGYTLTPINF